MDQPLQLRSNSQQHHIVIEREPLRAGAEESSVPVRQMHIAGYRRTGNAVVMLGNDIWNKDRAARFSLRMTDLLPLAEALVEMHAMLSVDLAESRTEPN